MWIQTGLPLWPCACVPRATVARWSRFVHLRNQTEIQLSQNNGYKVRNTKGGQIIFHFSKLVFSKRSALQHSHCHFNGVGSKNNVAATKNLGWLRSEDFFCSGICNFSSSAKFNTFQTSRRNGVTPLKQNSLACIYSVERPIAVTGRTALVWQVPMCKYSPASRIPCAKVAPNLAMMSSCLSLITFA